MMTLKEMLAELLESLTAQIRAAGKADDYCAITVYPGTMIPFDFGPDTGCAGTAWVRLVTASPTVSFPSPDAGIDNCGYSLAYVVEMGMVGPAPILEDHLGNFVLPTDVEQFDAAMRVADELAMMHRAIKAADIPLLVLGDYSPQGPEGGVLGGTWTLTIGDDD